MTERISADDQSILDQLFASDPLALNTFNWLAMAKWRTKKGVVPGVMGVELCSVADVAASEKAGRPSRFAPYPPRLVLAVDNGVVLFDDGRRIPAERAETFVSEAGDGERNIFKNSA